MTAHNLSKLTRTLVLRTMLNLPPDPPSQPIGPHVFCQIPIQVQYFEVGVLDDAPPKCQLKACSTPLSRLGPVVDIDGDYIGIRYKCPQCKSIWVDRFDGSDLQQVWQWTEK